MAKVCQLFSGSSGNSILVSYGSHNFLVDIGVSAKKCETALMDIGVDPKCIDAVFVTHEHIDHIKGVRVFASRHKTPVFASPLCRDQMIMNGDITDKVCSDSIDYHMELSGIEIQSFQLSHDSVDCVGYRFNFPDSRSVSICTDTGYVTDDAKKIMSGSDLVFLESNHEISMVETGIYPYYLKQRILGPQGHLSNLACSEFSKELAENGTTRFVLSHLSRENNTPENAYQWTISSLEELGMQQQKDFRLSVSPQENNGGCIVL